MFTPGFRGGVMPGFRPMPMSRFDPRFQGGRFDLRFQGGMFNPRFRGGMFEPDFRPRFR
jgi:hypothetical protein